MIAWSVVIAAAAGTYVFRSSLLWLLPERSVLPRWISNRLALVGPAALGSLIASSALRAADDRAAIILAVAAGFAAARITGKTPAALVVGFPVLWAAAAALP